MKNLTKSQIRETLSLLYQHYKDTTTALNFTSPFQLLISTILAAQSTDVRVNIVTKEIFPDFPDAQSFLSLSIEELEEKIKTVGLYKSKAKNAQEAHECIRPTEMDREPSKLARLEGDQKKLYDLIWKRTMACQMVPGKTLFL